MIRFLTAAFLLPFAAACAAATPPPAAVPAFTSERIGVTVVGSGPDVVLVPGLSSSPEVWRSTIEAMPGYRYHLVHVSGFAGRPAGANGSGEVVAPVAEEIARYIAESGLQRPAIVGHSLGGSLAMMVAARHPDLVSRLMVVDMLPFVGAMFVPGATPATVRPVAEQMRAGIVANSGAQRRATQEQMIATMIRTESLRPLAVEHGMASDLAVSAQAFYDLIVTDLTPELRNIRVPMTVLWVRPANAPISEEQFAGYYRMAYAGAPQARVVRVPNAWHFIMWDEPEAFRQELRSFLAAGR
jgi:pimeloyl-ACP methyl ester carboxylesterase